ncbi:MAG: DUF2791 family P-loop domain-containing protein [Desulfamplus sp.]|nr:DUF2791 family P-loop domain-containing protein [Desulfamplus sp.]
MKNDPDFETIVKDTPNFKLRRAVERLREGLFDHFGVKLLTSGETNLDQQFETQTENLEKGKPAHLCICGAYGQGKSHTLNYIWQQAIEENYAVSYINLDPREVPFHNLKQVYRSLMENLTFPCEVADSINFAANGNNPLNSNSLSNSNSLANGNRLSNGERLSKNNISPNDKSTLTNSTISGKNVLNGNGSSNFVDIWKKRVKRWLQLPENRGKSVVDMIPDNIPHRFKSILVAMYQQTEAISITRRNLKKHAGFKPREFPWILNNALMGKEIPVPQLKSALKYRKVSFYKDESLVCRGANLYMEAIKGYATMFKNIGYKGWVVLFDEAESIMLTSILNRSKSYAILHQIFCPDKASEGFLPVFAFTHDFFTYLKDEDFERTRIIRKRKPKGMTDATNKGTGNLLEGTQNLSENRKNLPENTKNIFENKDQNGENLHEETKILFFEQNYSKAWQNINIHRLRNLTSKEWHTLIRKLIQIHALAYRWEPDVDAMDKKIFSRLLKQSDAESRMKLKLIVNLLDLEQQQMVISAYT